MTAERIALDLDPGALLEAVHLGDHVALLGMVERALVDALRDDPLPPDVLFLIVMCIEAVISVRCREALEAAAADV
jgi:hypothetical protein